MVRSAGGHPQGADPRVSYHFCLRAGPSSRLFRKANTLKPLSKMVKWVKWQNDIFSYHCGLSDPVSWPALEIVLNLFADIEKP
jgi:hypothetical protein